ncbi:hypothetical protein COOONC_24585 [Cooperia oncophora]
MRSRYMRRLHISFYKTIYPKGLTSKTGSALDIALLSEALQKKMDSDRGGRLWRSTSASRLSLAAVLVEHSSDQSKTTMEVINCAQPL